MTAPRTTVTLTGVGLDGGPDIIRALRADSALSARVVGLDSEPDHASRHLCDLFHVVPPRNDPAYIETVASLASIDGARAIYPLPAFDQQLFADARGQLEQRGFAVPVSPPEAVHVCNDKWLTQERLHPTFPDVLPERRLVGSADELAAAARGLGYPRHRVCIRQRVGRGAIGFRVLDAGPARLRALLTENPGSPGSLLVSLDEVLDVVGQADSFPSALLVEEYLPGAEWDVDVLCQSGTAVIVAPRHNLVMTGGGAVKSVLKRNDELDALTRALVSELRLNAIVNVSFRFDRHGRPKLLEINPRIPSSILCALGGGANLVALAVRQALGEAIPPVDLAWGGRFLLHARSVVTDASGAAVIS